MYFFIKKKIKNNSEKDKALSHNKSNFDENKFNKYDSLFSQYLYNISQIEKTYERMKKEEVKFFI